MAQPTPYNRLYDFSDYQEVNPTKPLRGSEVDAEFDALKLTTDQLRANAALIQRDDGALANQVVTPDSLSAGALAMIHQGEYVPRGTWAGTTAYNLGDVVTYNAATYLCIVAHTAQAAFPDDLALGRWLLIANGALTGQASAIDLFEGNGTTTAYTLTFNYANSNAAVVFVAGVAQIPLQDFTISGTTLTFVVAPPAPSVAGRFNVMVRGTGLEAQLAADQATTAATNAQGFATSASTSATAAAASQTAAATSATSAATSASTATTQAGNASTSATSASGSATAASGSATAASGSATAASGSATAAANSATAAAGSATTASTQATNAATTATAALASQNAAATSATNAATSAASALSSLNSFRGQYYGPLASDPALDPLGNAPTAGDLYFNTTTNRLRVFNATTGGFVEGSSGSVAVQNFNGTGSQTAFTMVTAPESENNTQVYISGVYQQKDQYSISGTTLTFTSAPPTGTNNIEVVTLNTLPLGVTSADLVQFQPAGVGAVLRTVDAKLKEGVSVKDFGAVGDGVTDDTAAFQAAINSSLVTGAAIYLPGGTYKITDTLTIFYTNGIVPGATFKMYGDFSGTAVRLKTGIVFYGVSKKLFDIQLNSFASEGWEFVGFSVQQPQSDPSYQTSTAFSFTKSAGQYSRKHDIIDVNCAYFNKFIEFNGNPSVGTAVAPANYFGPVRVDRFHTWATNTGIELNHCTLNLITVKRGLFHGCSVGGGINCQGSGGSSIGLHIDDVHFEGCEPAAIRTAQYVSGIALSNVSAENTGDVSGYGLIDGSAPSVTTFHFSNFIYPLVFMPNTIRLPRGASVSSMHPIRISGEGIKVLTPDTISLTVANNSTYGQTDKYSVFLSPMPGLRGFIGTKAFKNSLAGYITNSGISPNSSLLPEGLRPIFVGASRLAINTTESFIAPSDGFLVFTWAAKSTGNNGLSISEILIDGVNQAPPIGFRWQANFEGAYTIVVPVNSGQVLTSARLTQYTVEWTTPCMIYFTPSTTTCTEMAVGFPRKASYTENVANSGTLNIRQFGEFNVPYAVKVRIWVNGGALGYYEFVARGTGSNAGRVLTDIVSSLSAGIAIANGGFPNNAEFYQKVLTNTTGASVTVTVEQEILS